MPEVELVGASLNCPRLSESPKVLLQLQVRSRGRYIHTTSRLTSGITCISFQLGSVASRRLNHHPADHHFCYYTLYRQLSHIMATMIDFDMTELTERFRTLRMPSTIHTPPILTSLTVVQDRIAFVIHRLDMLMYIFHA